MFVYEYRFTLNFMREVRTVDMQRFVDIIKAVFVQEGIFTSVADFTVVIVKLEEVFDATG